jgi:hypothetical protein
MPCLSAVGISGIHAGEDVKAIELCSMRPLLPTFTMTSPHEILRASENKNRPDGMAAP